MSVARVRDLHPGWFAAVIGTAIPAVAADANPGGLGAVQGIAHATALVVGCSSWR